MTKKNLKFLQEKKSKQKITMTTCYDYPTAVIINETDMDVVLIGDSVGTNVLGYDSEKEVTIQDIYHHLKAVRRGISSAYIVADLPYQTYQTPEMALTNARMLLSAGANGVKIEGIHEEITQFLHDHDIELWAHVGYNAQFHPNPAIFGKTYEQAVQLVNGVFQLQQAGAAMVVLELIPEEVASLITCKLKIPTIGIGAGRFTDGQVLVSNDLLGITPYSFRHAKKYTNLSSSIKNAFEFYIEDVKTNKFPNISNFKHMNADDLRLFENWSTQGNL